MIMRVRYSASFDTLWRRSNIAMVPSAYANAILVYGSGLYGRAIVSALCYDVASAIFVRGSQND